MRPISGADPRCPGLFVEEMNHQQFVDVSLTNLQRQEFVRSTSLR